MLMNQSVQIVHFENIAVSVVSICAVYWFQAKRKLIFLVLSEIKCYVVLQHCHPWVFINISILARGGVLMHAIRFNSLFSIFNAIFSLLLFSFCFFFFSLLFMELMSFHLSFCKILQFFSFCKNAASTSFFWRPSLKYYSTFCVIIACFFTLFISITRVHVYV